MTKLLILCSLLASACTVNIYERKTSYPDSTQYEKEESPRYYRTVYMPQPVYTPQVVVVQQRTWHRKVGPVRLRAQTTVVQTRDCL